MLMIHSYGQGAAVVFPVRFLATPDTMARKVCQPLLSKASHGPDGLFESRTRIIRDVMAASTHCVLPLPLTVLFRQARPGGSSATMKPLVRLVMCTPSSVRQRSIPQTATGLASRVTGVAHAGLATKEHLAVTCHLRPT